MLHAIENIKMLVLKTVQPQGTTASREEVFLDRNIKISRRVFTKVKEYTVQKIMLVSNLTPRFGEMAVTSRAL